MRSLVSRWDLNWRQLSWHCRTLMDPTSRTRLSNANKRRLRLTSLGSNRDCLRTKNLHLPSKCLLLASNNGRSAQRRNDIKDVFNKIFSLLFCFIELGIMLQAGLASLFVKQNSSVIVKNSITGPTFSTLDDYLQNHNFWPSFLQTPKLWFDDFSRVSLNYHNHCKTTHV